MINALLISAQTRLPHSNRFQLRDMRRKLIKCELNNVNDPRLDPSIQRGSKSTFIYHQLTETTVPPTQVARQIAKTRFHPLGKGVWLLNNLLTSSQLMRNKNTRERQTPEIKTRVINAILIALLEVSKMKHNDCL